MRQHRPSVSFCVPAQTDESKSTCSKGDKTREGADGAHGKSFTGEGGKLVWL